MTILANFRLITLKEKIAFFQRSRLLKMIFAKIIINLDPNKAHGYVMISIRVLKICNGSILKPLELIFKWYIEERNLPTEWKKENVGPVHKNDKQVIETIVQFKIIERLIYNKMFNFFTESELISQNQSSFKPGEFCIDQLLCTDKVWQESLLYKLKQNIFQVIF